MASDRPAGRGKAELESEDTVAADNACSTGDTPAADKAISTDDTLAADEAISTDDTVTAPPSAHDETAGVAPLSPTQIGEALASATGDSPRLRKGDAVGRLTVLKHLGEGAFGLVLAAYDPELDRKVALKVLKTSAFGSTHTEQASARFLREARAMARLNHPNVVTVHDVGTVEGHVYIAMEFAGGGTLKDWLAEKPRGWREVLDVFLEAGRGLSAAHEAGFAHRDFKPANVLLDGKGTARVGDFGLVSAGAETVEEDLRDDESRGDVSLDLTLTRTGELLGTPVYMAPEQHRGESADARADQFAFCASLYEAIYGTRPFAGASYAELAKNVLAGRMAEAPPDADVPVWIRTVLLRGLAIDPAERYESIDALLADLAHDPTLARRRKRKGLLVGTALVLLGVAAAYGYLQDRNDSEPRCTKARDKLAGVWDAETKDSVRRAFLATERSYATDVYARVERQLDHYTDAWAAMHTETCEATYVHHQQPERTMHLQMLCLEQRLDGVRSLTGILAHGPDAEIVDKAVEATLALRGLDECLETDSLSIATPLPSDPVERTRVEQLRTSLQKAEARKSLGKYEEARDLVKTVVEEARGVSYPPVKAEALFLLGSLHAIFGDAKNAEATLYEAVQAAAVANDDRLSAKAWIQLVWVVGFQQERIDEALAFRRPAEAALARTRNDPSLRASLDNALGGVHIRRQDYAEALRFFGNVLTISEQVYGKEHPEVAMALNNVAGAYRRQGKLDKARRHYERALAINQEALGPNHPDVANVLINLGRVLSGQGEHASAIRQFERALAIDEATLGPNHPYLTHELTGLGDCHLALEEPEEAIAPLERALELPGLDNADATQPARTRFLLARALWDAKKDRRRALELAEQARDGYAEAGEAAKKELAEVEHWLAARG